MDELNARIDFLGKEIARCRNLSVAAGNLSGALKRIKDKLNSCSSSLAAGGFTIDGTGADVVSFGGYEKYATNNITPVTKELDWISSILSTAIINYDKELTNCIYRRDKLRKEQEENKKNKKEDKSNKDETEKKIPKSRYLRE